MPAVLLGTRACTAIHPLWYHTVSKNTAQQHAPPMIHRTTLITNQVFPSGCLSLPSWPCMRRPCFTPLSTVLLFPSSFPSSKMQLRCRPMCKTVTVVSLCSKPLLPPPHFLMSHSRYQNGSHCQWEMFRGCHFKVKFLLECTLKRPIFWVHVHYGPFTLSFNDKVII